MAKPIAATVKTNTTVQKAAMSMNSRVTMVTVSAGMTSVTASTIVPMALMSKTVPRRATSTMSLPVPMAPVFQMVISVMDILTVLITVMRLTVPNGAPWISSHVLTVLVLMAIVAAIGTMIVEMAAMKLTVMTTVSNARNMNAQMVHALTTRRSVMASVTAGMDRMNITAPADKTNLHAVMVNAFQATYIVIGSLIAGTSRTNGTVPVPDPSSDAIMASAFQIRDDVTFAWTVTMAPTSTTAADVGITNGSVTMAPVLRHTNTVIDDMIVLIEAMNYTAIPHHRKSTLDLIYRRTHLNRSSKKEHFLRGVK